MLQVYILPLGVGNALCEGIFAAVQTLYPTVKVEVLSALWSLYEQKSADSRLKQSVDRKWVRLETFNILNR